LGFPLEFGNIWSWLFGRFVEFVQGFVNSSAAFLADRTNKPEVVEEVKKFFVELFEEFHNISGTCSFGI